jgi:acrylyl-CoA reductase (NADPH)
MRAWILTKDAGGVTARLDDSMTEGDLGSGGVLVDVQYSSINFKDGLALAGRPGVVRNYPLIPGIDLVGTVASSDSSEWAIGDPVIVNGWGIGESHNGGLAQRARVEPGWLVRLPDGMTPQRAAAIGTAGFTAMLAVLALERSDALGGSVLVTGAAGGVGSVAIAILAALGRRVVASTGRPEAHDYLTSLGAAEIIHREELSTPGKALQSERWAGAIDTVGGATLANVLAQTRYGGTVAACGLAGGSDLPSTVMPFILRGVTLTGINSVFAPAGLRTAAWRRLASDLDPAVLDGITTTAPLGEALAVAERILAGHVRGRTVIDVRA